MRKLASVAMALMAATPFSHAQEILDISRHSRAVTTAMEVIPSGITVAAATAAATAAAPADVLGA